MMWIFVLYVQKNLKRCYRKQITGLARRQHCGPAMRAAAEIGLGPAVSAAALRGSAGLDPGVSAAAQLGGPL